MHQHKLPHPINGTEQYLAAIYDRLGDVLDRLPAQAAPADGALVDLKEPAKPKARAKKADA